MIDGNTSCIIMSQSSET